MKIQYHFLSWSQNNYTKNSWENKNTVSTTNSNIDYHIFWLFSSLHAVFECFELSIIFHLWQFKNSASFICKIWEFLELLVKQNI